MQSLPEREKALIERLSAAIGKSRDTTSRDRMLSLVETLVAEDRRFKDLQEMTGIPAATWRTWWNREKARPSTDMIEGVSKQWPEYAFWLITGGLPPVNLIHKLV